MRWRGSYSFPAVALLAGAGMLAMAIAHACELWLEDLQLFGDARAAYTHSGQSLCIALGVTAIALAVLAVGCRVLGAARSSCDEPTGLGTIPRAGRLRAGAFLLSFQLLALVLVELAEQRFSGIVHPSLAAVFGAGHASTLIVHLVVGIALAIVAYAFADAVSAKQAVWTAALSTFVRRMRSAASSCANCRLRQLQREFRLARRTPLALRLANRPPPLASLA